MGLRRKIFIDKIMLQAGGEPSLELGRLQRLGVWGPTTFGVFLLSFTLAFHHTFPVWLIVLSVLSISAAGASLFSWLVFSQVRQWQGELTARASQQAAVAELGQRALAGTDLSTLMNEAVALVARTLGVEYCKALELLPDGAALLLRAGVGWKEGSVGRAMVSVGTDSQAGYTLLSKEPVIVEDLRTETRFSGPPLLHDHGVVSGMSVTIQGLGRPYGVLGAHTTRRRAFTKDDVHSLQSVANVLAMAIERKQAEEAAFEMNMGLVNAMPGISRLDPVGRYVEVNEAYARMMGYQPGEMIGMDWAPTVHPDDRGKALGVYQRMLSEGKAEFEAKAIRKDGSVFHKHVLMVKRVGKEGKSTGHHCFMRDITERKRAELTREALYWASLQIQEPLGLQERLARLLKTARDVLNLDRLNILLADPESRWLEGAATLGTKDPAETMRIPIGPEGGGIAQVYLSQQPIIWSDSQAALPEWSRLKPPYDRLEAFRSRAFAIFPLVVQGRAIGVLGADRKHSRQPLEPELIPLLQIFAAQAALAIEHGRLYERQRMAALELEATVEARTRELRAANAQLQEVTREAEKASNHKSAFLANMSHELRTPLNSILGFSELLQQQTYGPLTPKQANYLDHIHASGKHLLALISDILDLSKVEAGKLEMRPQSFEAREAMAAALRTIRPQADAKRQRLSLQAPGDLPTLVADPVRINQVLLNLLSNAVKFTPEGGSITVTANTVPSATCQVPSLEPGTRDSEPGTPKSPDFVEISVADTGIGINAEGLQRLFQPFTQLEPVLTKRYEGSGLGLALTKKLVELHGGMIWAESPGEGKGSTFTVRLPLAGSQATPRLLVVDDDETLLGTIRDALKAAGYHIETAADGAAALAQVEAARPDLVILDLSLPQVNGWEVLRSLRADTSARALPVLVITGVEVGRGDEILTGGADEFLAKPFSVPVLVHTVQRLLEQGPAADRVRGWQTRVQTS